MATVSKARYTPEDLLDIQDRPMPELVDGELLEREMGQEADWIASNLIFFLVQFVRQHDLGFVNGGQGSYQVFPDDPNKVRIPDVSFTRKERNRPRMDQPEVTDGSHPIWRSRWFPPTTRPNISPTRSATSKGQEFR